MADDAAPEMRVIIRLEKKHIAIPRYSPLSLSEVRDLQISGVLLLNVCIFMEANLSQCAWVSQNALLATYKRNCKRFAADTVILDELFPSVLCNLFFGGILDMQLDRNGGAMWRLGKTLDDLFRQLLHNCKDRCVLLEKAIELAGEHAQSSKSLFIQVLVLQFLVEYAARVPNVMQECIAMKM